MKKEIKEGSMQDTPAWATSLEVSRYSVIGAVVLVIAFLFIYYMYSGEASSAVQAKPQLGWGLEAKFCTIRKIWADVKHLTNKFIGDIVNTINIVRGKPSLDTETFQTINFLKEADWPQKLTILAVPVILLILVERALHTFSQSTIIAL